MDIQDFDYYRDRMAAEEQAASTARDPRAADAHRRLAENYAKLVGTGAQGGGRGQMQA